MSTKRTPAPLLYCPFFPLRETIRLGRARPDDKGQGGTGAVAVSELTALDEMLQPVVLSVAVDTCFIPSLPSPSSEWSTSALC